MQITIHVPDDLIEKVKHKLPPPESGVLEAVGLDAILALLMRLDSDEPPKPETNEKQGVFGG